MTETDLDVDQQRVFAVTEEEAAAIESGDME